MQLVVFVLDSSPSMNTPYPAGSSKTRLDVAKEALQNMLCDLIIESTYNKANVVVCKTATTDHHLYSDKMMKRDDDVNDEEGVPFPNVTALAKSIDKPSLELLKRAAAVQSTLTPEESEMARGDVVDGIMVAADALHRETSKTKTATAQRKVVVITDAEHDFIVDEWQRNQLVVAMIRLNCRMEVIGLDFQASADFASRPMDVLSETKIKFEANLGEAGNETIYSDKKEKEDALVRIAEETGGRVIAASTLQEILVAKKGLKTTNPILYKCQLSIAPKFEIDVKYLLMSRKFDLPRMTQKVVLEDGNEQPRLDHFGHAILDSVLRTYDYTLEAEVGSPSPALLAEEDTIRAYPYNTANVPTDADDENLILSELGYQNKPVRIEILGYMDRSRVPDCYSVGPPTLISGELSQKACGAIAAMAEALAQTDKVALCTFYKKKDKPGHFGGLFPFPEPEFPNIIHLVFMALPYAGDVQNLDKELFPLDELVVDSRPAEAAAVDDLIDSLMLSNDVLAAGSVPNPLMRSWHQTLMKRLVDPSCEPVLWRHEQDRDPISTPPKVLKGAVSALGAFRKSFPLKDMVKLAKEEKAKNKRQKGKPKVHNFEDYLKK